MGDTTKIEWCDRTFNPFYGCTKISPGCDNCYAEKMMDKRMHKVQWGPGMPRVRAGEVGKFEAPVLRSLLVALCEICNGDADGFDVMDFARALGMFDLDQCRAVVVVMKARSA